MVYILMIVFFNSIHEQLVQIREGRHGLYLLQVIFPQHGEPCLGLALCSAVFQFSAAAGAVATS